jgi:hypothetical protein
MRRRDLIAGLVGTATWPIAARAQQSERIRLIGNLTYYVESDPEVQLRLGVRGGPPETCLDGGPQHSYRGCAMIIVHERNHDVVAKLSAKERSICASEKECHVR